MKMLAASKDDDADYRNHVALIASGSGSSPPNNNRFFIWTTFWRHPEDLSTPP
jgi:hypothetical protein